MRSAPPNPIFPHSGIVTTHSAQVTAAEASANSQLSANEREAL